MPVETSITMPEHQQRVVVECEELEVKINKLSEFINGPIFQTVDEFEKELLKIQLDAMKVYHKTLLARISNWKK